MPTPRPPPYERLNQDSRIAARAEEFQALRGLGTLEQSEPPERGQAPGTPRRAGRTPRPTPVPPTPWPRTWFASSAARARTCGGRRPAAGGRISVVRPPAGARHRKNFQEFEDTVASYEEVIEFRRMCGHPDCFIRVASPTTPPTKLS
ncbi:hypothetical protein ABZV75_10635 [Streptomyces flaveolus]|uniref:hypothetical protein n=1 Tax=Streptomyces flaveolus TaxID=67297 RepID=UPI0033A29277